MLILDQLECEIFKKHLTLSCFYGVIYFWTFMFSLAHGCLCDYSNFLPVCATFCDFLHRNVRNVQSSLWSLNIFLKCWLFVCDLDMISPYYFKGVGTVPWNSMLSVLKLTAHEWTYAFKVQYENWIFWKTLITKLKQYNSVNSRFILM